MPDRPSRSRRDAIRALGTLGLGGILSSTVTARGHYTIIGDNWYGHTQNTVSDVSITGGGYMDLSQHVAAEYVGVKEIGGENFRLFDIATISVASYRKIRAADPEPALWMFGFDIDSGENGSTSGIDRIDTDVVHGGRPMSRTEILNKTKLSPSELGDKDAIKDAVEHQSKPGLLNKLGVSISLFELIAARSSLTVLSAVANPYATVAGLVFGLLGLLTPDLSGGEKYRWEYPRAIPADFHSYSVGVAHYKSLPVQMDPHSDGEFTVSGYLLARYNNFDYAFEPLDQEIKVNYEAYDRQGGL